jgi:hypothetical protein
MALRVDLGSIQMNTDVADANGTKWYVQDIEGWSSPAIRQSIVAPTSRHGGVITEGMLDARAVILRGLFKAPSEATFWTAYNDINAAVVNLFTASTVMKVYETTTKRLSVVRGGEVRINFVGLGAGEFEVPLLAPDPLKYSDTLNGPTALAATITNAGNFFSLPIITLTGGGSYTITNTTQGASASLIVVGAPAGTIIDFNARTVLSGSTDYYSIVDPLTVWWELLPGANIITKSGGAATISWRDAWL